MASQPWFKFFAGDWFSDGKLRMCRAEGIAVWIQALTYMHKEGTYSISGEIIELSMALNLPESQTDEGIRQLEKYDVCEVERDSHGCVTLTSRRLKREDDERAAARERKRLQRQREREADEEVTDKSDVHTRGHALTSDSDSSKALSKKSKKEDSPDYDAVMQSWNDFAEEMGLPKILKMTKKRRDGVRSRYEDVWPHIEQVYENIRGSPFLRGEEGRSSWRGANFDYLWVNGDNYIRVLEGTHSGKADRRASQGGRTVPGTGENEAGTGGQVPRSLSPGERQRIAQKRDGELTNFEYLIRCGLSEQEAGELAGYGYTGSSGLTGEIGGRIARLHPGDPADWSGDGTRRGEGATAADRRGAGEGEVDVGRTGTG